MTLRSANQTSPKPGRSTMIAAALAQTGSEATGALSSPPPTAMGGPPEQLAGQSTIRMPDGLSRSEMSRYRMRMLN